MDDGVFVDIYISVGYIRDDGDIVDGYDDELICGSDLFFLGFDFDDLDKDNDDELFDEYVDGIIDDGVIIYKK